jgi:hypothetical protein
MDRQHGMNENGILLNGRLHKILDDIVFEYDGRDFMRPWRMRTDPATPSNSNSPPFYDPSRRYQLLVIRSSAHHCSDTTPETSTRTAVIPSTNPRLG